MSVEKRVKAFIREQKLIEEGDRILLGLSGGADSVCLFYLLLGFREEFGFDLRAVHVHHGIRPEADSDAAYVEGLCEKEGIRCLVFREDVPACAKERGLGEEEAGRMLRYMDFETCLKSWQEENGEELLRFKIATAHHENDQAETVLFQLFRGCGLAGMRGMLPKRDHIIRPLLCLSRKEIEQFLAEKGVTWREDKTNQSEDYSRNKIRHRILSYAERELNFDAAGHIAKTAAILREAEDYIRRQVKEAYSRTVKEGEGFVAFDIPALHGEDIFVRRQLILYGLERLLTARKDIGAVHVEDVLKLSEKQGNGEISLPAKIKARKSYRKLVLFLEDGKDADGAASKILLEDKGFLYGEEAPVAKTLRIDLADGESVKEHFGTGEISEILHHIPQKAYTKWFDCDKIEMPFSVRHPESGDYLTIDERMNRKSFRRYMIEEKIPASYRNRIWLLAAGSHVIWVPGGRMSFYYKVTAQTKNILQVKIERKE